MPLAAHLRAQAARRRCGGSRSRRCGPPSSAAAGSTSSVVTRCDLPAVGPQQKITGVVALQGDGSTRATSGSSTSTSNRSAGTARSSRIGAAGRRARPGTAVVSGGMPSASERIASTQLAVATDRRAARPPARRSAAGTRPSQAGPGRIIRSPTSPSDHGVHSRRFSASCDRRRHRRPGSTIGGEVEERARRRGHTQAVRVGGRRRRRRARWSGAPARPAAAPASGRRTASSSTSRGVRRSCQCAAAVMSETTAVGRRRGRRRAPAGRSSIGPRRERCTPAGTRACRTRARTRRRRSVARRGRAFGAGREVTSSSRSSAMRMISVTVIMLMAPTVRTGVLTALSAHSLCT